MFERPFSDECEERGVRCLHEAETVVFEGAFSFVKVYLKPQVCTRFPAYVSSILSFMPSCLPVLMPHSGSYSQLRVPGLF